MVKLVCVAKTVVLNPDGQVLLLRRSQSDPRRPGQWDMPGGGVEDGETFAQGAARELEEEAGITVPANDLTLLYTGTDFYEREQHNVHRSLFVAHIGQTAAQNVQLSFEHDASQWVSVEQALTDFNHPFYATGLRYAVRHDLLS